MSTAAHRRTEDLLPDLETAEEKCRFHDAFKQRWPKTMRGMRRQLEKLSEDTAKFKRRFVRDVIPSFRKSLLMGINSSIEDAQLSALRGIHLTALMRVADEIAPVSSSPSSSSSPREGEEEQDDFSIEQLVADYKAKEPATRQVGMLIDEVNAKIAARIDALRSCKQNSDRVVAQSQENLKQRGLWRAATTTKAQQQQHTTTATATRQRQQSLSQELSDLCASVHAAVREVDKLRERVAQQPSFSISSLPGIDGQTTSPRRKRDQQHIDDHAHSPSGNAAATPIAQVMNHHQQQQQQHTYPNARERWRHQVSGAQRQSMSPRRDAQAQRSPGLANPEEIFSPQQHENTSRTAVVALGSVGASGGRGSQKKEEPLGGLNNYMQTLRGYVERNTTRTTTTTTTGLGGGGLGGGDNNGHSAGGRKNLGPIDIHALKKTMRESPAIVAMRQKARMNDDSVREFIHLVHYETQKLTVLSKDIREEKIEALKDAAHCLIPCKRNTATTLNTSASYIMRRPDHIDEQQQQQMLLLAFGGAAEGNLVNGMDRPVNLFGDSLPSANLQLEATGAKIVDPSSSSSAQQHQHTNKKAAATTKIDTGKHKPTTLHGRRKKAAEEAGEDFGDHPANRALQRKVQTSNRIVTSTFATKSTKDVMAPQNLRQNVSEHQQQQHHAHQNEASSSNDDNGGGLISDRGLSMGDDGPSARVVDGEDGSRALATKVL